MVSILPAQRSSWDVIGDQLGQNLNRSLPGAIEKGFERGMGLKAIDDLQKSLQEANGDISKMLPAIAKAYTLNPNLERSGIAEKFIPLMQRKTGQEDLTPRGHPTKQGATPEEKVPVSVTDLVPPRQSQVADPSGVSQFQLPYGPDEMNAVRQKARQLGYMPEIEERFVNDMKEYNQIAQTRREIELQNYQQAQQQRRDTLENQKEFEKYLSSHSPEFASNPDELELALKASEKYQNEPSFAERNAKVKQELRPYQAAKEALKKTLKRPLFGQTKEQRALARPRAKFMVEKGQKPQLQMMIAEGGNGEVEEADLLNPLPEKFEQQLNSFQNFKNPLEYVKNADPDSPEYGQQLEKGRKAREGQNKFATDYLASTIKPGSFNEPGTNLILTRYHLMNKGASWEEAAKMIDDAVAKGKIKLDPQQQIDYQKLAYPPLTGDTYLDTIMNNLMFPVTGKQ